MRLLHVAPWLAVVGVVAACGSAKDGEDGPSYPSGVLDGGSTTKPGDKPPPPAGVFDWRDAVLYFAFVDRFSDGDLSNNCSVAGAEAPGQYKGGDWKGVTKKIEENYFTDLGVNVVWLSVPMQNATVAGRGNGQGSPPDNHMYSAFHGYWPKELDKAEACFGSKQDLVDLVKAAHTKGIKVLFDYAMVHVHDTSPTYKDHADWFWPKLKAGGLCVCADTGPCTWQNQGDRCWFADYLPHFDYRVKAARDWSIANAVQWVKDTGVDGYRLDAIKHVDGAWLTDLRREINAQITSKQSPQQTFYMVGETFEFQNRGYLKSFVDAKAKLDGQFDFPLRIRLAEAVLMRSNDKLLTPDDTEWSRNAPSGMAGLAAFIEANDGYYGADAVMSTFIGNHDLPRSIHLAEDSPRFKSADDGKNGCSGVCAWSNPLAVQPPGLAPYERLGNAFAVLLTTKGAPLIYYGDEVGLAGAGDPDNRRMMAFELPGEGPKFLKERVAKLAAARKAHAALRRGTRKTLFVDADLWVFETKIANAADPANGDTVVVAINRSDTARTTDKLPAAALTELLTGTSLSGPNAPIPPRQSRVFAAK